MQAEELAKGRDHAKAEEIYSELVGFQNLPEIVQQAFWWEICKLRVKLERAKAAIDACSYSVKTRPDDEDAVVQKVISPSVVFHSMVHLLLEVSSTRELGSADLST